MKIVDKLVCPECGGTEFQRGPRGGVAMNVRCRCGHEMNVSHLPDGRWWIIDDDLKLLPEAVK